jgi:ABC-2 type transport system permease protein
MSVLRALLYLRLTSLANVLRSQLRRLRQPKYLIGVLAAAGYFWLFFFRRRGPGSPGQFFNVMFGNGETAELIAAGALALFLFFTWLTLGDQPGLAFTEAEVAFLFPAPLSRRQLIHYKLINGLILSLFSSVFFVFIFIGLRGGWSGALRHWGAWWALNANLSLHQNVAALSVAWLSQHGLRTFRRRLILLGGLGLVVAAGLVVAWHFGPRSLAWFLWPTRLVVRPFLATGLGNYLGALGPALGVIALQYLWVLRLESPFEDASIARAQKVGETVARMRAGKSIRFSPVTKARRAPFRLENRLPAEFAFLWKNLMAAPAYLNRRTFLICVAVLVFGLTWLKRQPGLDDPKLLGSFAIIPLVAMAYVLVFGPQLARNDLRGDLMNADLLKTYPLPGWRIVLGELLAPTLVLTAICWLLLLAIAVMPTPPPGESSTGWFAPELRIVIVVSLAAITPALCALQLLVPNAGALLFPAWAPTGRPADGGFDVKGQRLIFFAGQFLCLILALLPAALLAALTIILTQWLLGLPGAIALSVIPVLGVLAGELWFGVWLLGPRFERLDISAELRP